MNPVGMPYFCGEQGGIQTAAIVTQRRSGALHQRKDGALAQFVLAADDERRHFDRGSGFAFVINRFGLHVFGGVFPDGLDLMQAAGFRRFILRRDRNPVKGDFFGRVGNAGNVAYV